MKLKQYNKGTIAVLSGAVCTIIGAVVVVDATVMDAIQTLVTAGLVVAIPNLE